MSCSYLALHRDAGRVHVGRGWLPEACHAQRLVKERSQKVASIKYLAPTGEWPLSSCPCRPPFHVERRSNHQGNASPAARITPPHLTPLSQTPIPCLISSRATGTLDQRARRTSRCGCGWEESSPTVVPSPTNEDAVLRGANWLT